MEGRIVRRVVECVEVYERRVGEWLFGVEAWKEVFKPERVVCKAKVESRWVASYRRFQTNSKQRIISYKDNSTNHQPNFLSFLAHSFRVIQNPAFRPSSLHFS